MSDLELIREIIELQRRVEKLERIESIGQGAAVADADAGTVVAQLNALLAELRTLGVIAT